MTRTLYRLVACCALLAAVSSGCASAVTSIDRTSEGTYVLTGQTNETGGGVRGFVWEGTYDATARVFTIRKKAICPP